MVMQDISRRGFVGGAAAMGAAATLGASAARAALASEGAQGEGESGISSSRPEAGQGRPERIDTLGDEARPIDPVGAPATWDGDADVIVVGSGMGGLTATLYLAQAGERVICVEKDSFVGGASRHACFNHINSGGSAAQTEAGWYWPTQTEKGTPLQGFDAKQAAAAWERHYQYSVEPQMLTRAIEESGRWADWMQSRDGVKWQVFAGGYCFVDEDVAQGKQNVILGNDRTIQALYDDAVAAGADIRTSTPLTALVYEDGRVQGVEVDAGESALFLKAEKGVILCAGGFGYNMDMMERWIPSAYLYGVQGGPLVSHTGEAIRMAQGVGADMSGYNSFCSWDGCLDEYWGEGSGSYWSYLFTPTRDVMCNPFLTLDAAGQRLPFYASQDNFENSPFTGGTESTTSSYMASADHRKRVIMDADFKQHLEEFKTSYMGGNSRLDPLEFYGETSEMGKAFVGDADFDEDWQKHIDNGSVKTADSLEELAPMIGMAPETLVAAVEDWNRIVDQGEDDELPIQFPPELMTKVEKPPFYAAVSGGQIAKTLCGLRVNPKMQVMSTDHEPIEGLYAGWTTAGGLCGENMINGMWGKCSPFGSVAMSGVGGWLAAKGIRGEFDS